MLNTSSHPESFGAWVRKRRKLLDLTQESLAQAASLSASAIRKIESDGRRPSRETAELLSAALQVDAGEREYFLHLARMASDTPGDDDQPGMAPPDASSPPPPTTASLPQAPPVLAPPHPIVVDAIAQRPLPTSPLPIVGRAQEIAQILALLADPQCRLLTIVGAGGMGKTRLALEVARRSADAHAHGAVFVELTPLTSADYVPAAVAGALGLASATQSDPAAAVIDYLARRSLLLVLDNMEHLLVGAPFISDLLANTSSVKIIVTSREHLNLSGEWVFELQGLPVRRIASAATPGDAATAQSAPNDASPQDSAAVTLFIQRAQQADVTFQLDAERRAAINQICTLLGGMPLAIELAASWVRVLAPGEILEEMSRSLDFLAANRRDLPPRHRSMRAVFDQSWMLLGEREQRTLRRIAVLRGSFSREAVRAIAEGSLGEISTLVAKSLLIHGANATSAAATTLQGAQSANANAIGAGRYRVHEMVRQFAREHLEEAGEEQATHRRMLDFYTDFTEKGYRAARGEGYVRWIETLKVELDNLRLALEWGFEHDLQRALQLFCNLRMLWEQRSADEASEWMSRAIALSDASPGVPDELRARVLGMAAWVDRDHRQAAQRAERALALARKVGDDNLAATVLPLLGHAAIRDARPDEAEPFFAEAIAIAERLQDGALEASVRNEAGKADRYLGNYARAHAHHARALELARAVGQPALQADASLNLNLIAMRTGDYRLAQSWIEDNLAISRAIGDRPAYGWALQSMVRCFIFLGEFERAGNLLDQLRTFVEETPYRNQPENVRMLSGDYALLQGDLDRAEREYWASLATAQDPFYRGWCYRGLGSIARFRRDWDQARAHLQNAIAIAEATHERWNRGLTHIMLADVAHETGDAAAEAQHLADSFSLLEPLGDKWGLARWCESSARRSLANGDPLRAATLQGAADALRAAGGSQRANVERARNASLRTRLEEALGASAFNAALAKGALLAQNTRTLIEREPFADARNAQLA